jgi:hypothetical protein
MAERKLRTDTAHTAAAIPQPHIRVPTPDAGSFATADGPVQPDSKSPVIKESLDDSPSSLERAVRQKLISAPEVSISSLLVQQIEGGVCLYGILETHGDMTDVESLVRSVASVDRVLNRLVHRPPDASG